MGRGLNEKVEFVPEPDFERPEMSLEQALVCALRTLGSVGAAEEPVREAGRGEAPRSR